jgi:hypothetical protein
MKNFLLARAQAGARDSAALFEEFFRAGLQSARKPLSAATKISKSPGSVPRTRHCMASRPAMRSTVQSRSAVASARKWAATPDRSQNTKELGRLTSDFLD